MDDPEILDKKPILSLHAVLPMKKSLDRLLFLVEIGDNRFCVVMGASSEDIHIVVKAHIGQEFEAIGPHVELELISFAGKLHISFVVGKNRVDKSLIEVQNKKLLLRV